MINTMDETRFLIDGAIRLNQINRWKIMSDDKHLCMSPDQFVREFGTVSFNIGQRTDLTNYIGQNATRRDIIITHNRDSARHIINTNSWVPNVLPYTVFGDKYIGFLFCDDTTFWIDNYSLMSSEVDRILGPFITSYYQTIIKLG